MKRSDRIARSSHVFGLLARVVHRTANDADVLLRGEDLNPAQYQLLLAVGRHPESTQRALGERLAVTVSNVSMLVTKLESAGLLRREARGAANLVSLTERGEAVAAHLAPEYDTFMLHRFAALDDEELIVLCDLMDKTWRGLPDPA